MKTFAEWEDVIVDESKAQPKAPGQQAGGSGGGKKGRAPATASGQAGGGGAPSDGSSGAGAGSGSGRAAAGAGQASGKPRVPCLSCGSTAHLVMACPDLQGKDDEKKRLLAEHRAKRAATPQVARLVDPVVAVPTSETRGQAAATSREQPDRGTAPALLPGKIAVEALLDSGADVSFVSGALVSEMEKCGEFLEIARLSTPQWLEPLGERKIEVLREIRIRGISLTTSAGQLILPPVVCFVEENCSKMTLILGRPLMRQLGYSTEGLLREAVRKLPEQAPVTAHEDAASNVETAVPPSSLRMNQLRLEEDASTDYDERMALPDPRPTSMDDVRKVLADATPTPSSQVQFKEDAKPTRCTVRRMNPVYLAYVERHIKELLDGGRFRCGGLCRTELIPLYVALGGAEHFLNLDAGKMFWQLPLHADSQEPYSIMTHIGLFSPLRVLMGATDAPAYAQQASELVFADQLLKEVLVWLDDVLGYAKTPMQLMGVLERALKACVQYGLKLNPRKCVFYAREIKWCGRILSATGITHCPERISGLVGLDAPVTAADLQQFICAVNWMRSSIPNYNRVVAPLAALLEGVARTAKSRKKQALKKVELLGGLWEAKHQDAYNEVKKALAAITPLAYPRRDANVCVFTDASLDHWGAVVTQVTPVATVENIVDQEHEPLAFLSGSFVGASARWPIVEKEAFAIVETCKRLEYLLLRDLGFRIYTDHRNLIYIFDPYATDPSMPRFQAGKLQRWAITMTMFRYDIYHISGEDNVWGDLLSRWGASETSERQVRVNALAVVDQVSPLQAPDFEWPALEAVLAAQRVDLRERGSWETLPHVVWNETDQIYETPAAKVWVPDAAVDLQQRLCVVAHAGAAGHRGQAVTAQVLGDKFEWSTLKDDVRTFVQGCLHCLVVKGDKVPRPYGATLRATKPNEVLHFDYLSMPLGDDMFKYVLVLKDNMSGFVELIECTSADADVVYKALMDWLKRFGVVQQWVSDQGSHFLNMVIEAVQKALGSQHHFVTAHCRWANGTVEVVNRLLLRVLKTLLSEQKLPPSEWPKLLPVVQAALNAMPSDRLGGVAPVTAFTQLPATTPLSVLFHPVRKENVTIEWVTDEQRRHLRETADALENMHRELSAEAEKKRRVARERHAQKQGVAMPKFRLGDFVLVGQVVTHVNKLALSWRGPRRIVRVIHDHTYEVQNLCPPHEVTVHHASRLQWYAEASREVTTDLLDHVRYGEGGHLVEKFLETRDGPDTQQLEIKVQWMGLDPLEASWEIAAELVKDVPVLLTRFANTFGDTPHRQQLQKLLATAVKPTAKSRKSATPMKTKGVKVSVKSKKASKARPGKQGKVAKGGGGK